MSDPGNIRDVEKLFDAINAKEEPPKGQPGEVKAFVTKKKSVVPEKAKTTGNVILREGPSTNTKILKYLIPNTELEVLDEKIGWAYVKYRGIEGYVSSKYIDVTQEEQEVVHPQPKTEPDEPAYEDDTPSKHKVSRTTDRVNFRRTPEIPHLDKNENIIETLNTGTEVKITGETGNWLKVTVNGQEGYVHRDYVTVSDFQEKKTGFVPTSNPNIIVDFDEIVISPEFDKTQARIANHWNSYGNSVIKFSNEMGVDTDLLFGVMMGVLITESGGSGFRNGKLLIRFEVHLFYHYWGKRNRKTFDQHFKFNETGRNWVDHAWRRRKRDPWIEFHALHWSKKNDAEWEVLNFARGLDAYAANASTSFGMPQILGGNWRNAGFTSASHMIEAFSEDEKNHIFGFLSFLKNKKGITEALQNKDIGEFARLYNGSGQTNYYKNLISGPMETIKQIRAI